MDNSIIVNSIKKLCKDNNITVSQLEKETGMSQGLISKWKDKIPSLDKIVDIADYFNVTIDEVIGRTLKSNNVTAEEFIDKLFNMTVNKILEWIDMTNSISQMEKDEKYYLEDCGYDIRELFGACYREGSFWIYAQYSEEKGNISESYIEIYIQPNSDSKIVLQDVNDAMAEKLWMYVHTLIFGSPDEVKAEEFKNNFVLNTSLTNSNELLSGNLKNNLDIEAIDKVINDPAILKLMEIYNQPEFKKMQETFNNPEVQAAIQIANKLQHYFDK